MPRKKKEKVKVNNETDEFVYCDWRHCIHNDCLRHNVNTPWNVLIYMKKFKPDKNWNCKDKVTE